MSLRDLEKLGARQMETIKRKQDREIKRLESGHQDLKVELKKSHQAEIVDLNHENERQVAGEADKKEKVLAQMREHLESTRKLTDKQLNEYKTQAEKSKAYEHKKLSLSREQVKSDHDLHMEDVNYRYNQTVKKVAADGKNQLQQMKDVKHQEIAQTEEHFQQRIQGQTQNFNTRYQADSMNYKKIKDDQDKQFKNERASTNLRQQVEMGKLSTNHNTQLEVRDNEFRKGLKEQDQIFEQKYAEQLKFKNGDIQRLNEKHAQVLGKMKADLQDKLEYHVSRSDDPFYKFTQLRPELKHFEDRIEIKVEIPDHAKSDLQLTTNDKEAILTFNRRHDDIRKEGQITNKLHKVESFTTRLMTEHHLDPKSVKSSFENGTMTYVVKKA
jgi:HSP20 family molecular chaperone IbpA